MKTVWPVLVILAIFLTYIHLNQSFAPYPSEFGPLWMGKTRIPGLVISCLALSVFGLWLSRTEKKVAVVSTMFLGTSLWWMLSSLFYPLTGLTFLAICLVLLFENKGLRWLLLVILALSGLMGTMWGLVYSTHKKDWLLLVIVVLIGSRAVLTDNAWVAAQTTIPKIAEEVRVRMQEEFKVNGYNMIWPFRVKLLGYNTYYFAVREGYKELVKVMDFDFLTSPGQQSATISRGLWTAKGLPVVYFWLVLLAIWGLFNRETVSDQLKKTSWILLVWGLLAGMVSPGPKLVQSAIGVAAFVAIWAGVGFINLRNMGKIVVVVIGSLGITFGTWHLLTHELYWRDNRPWVFEQMAKSAVKHGAGRPVVASSLLGDPSSYFTSQATFRHFDLTTEKLDKEIVYIGLPGEFLGDRSKKGDNHFESSWLPSEMKLLETIPIHDTVSFGNGDSIWVVETK